MVEAGGGSLAAVHSVGGALEPAGGSGESLLSPCFSLLPTCTCPWPDLGSLLCRLFLLQGGALPSVTLHDLEAQDRAEPGRVVMSHDVTGVGTQGPPRDT